MTIQFRPAVRANVPVFLGIAGPSRGGKTYSALRIATGMRNGRPIFFIDTETSKALQYADKFEFMHYNLEAPFTPERYLEAITAAKDAGAGVIIVDSMSHEHEGPGGILEQHETELQRMAGDDWGKRERVKFTAWIKPKAAHNRFVNSVLQIDAHMIFCFRAKDKLAMTKNAAGKNEPVSMGWQPICADRFEYEMTSMLVLPESANGIPDLGAKASGLRAPLDEMIQAGQQLDEQLGQKLAAWAIGDGGKIEPRQSPLEIARGIASQGKDAFTKWWQGDGRPHRDQLRPHIEELQGLARKADEVPDDDDPFADTETPEPADNRPAEDAPTPTEADSVDADSETEEQPTSAAPGPLPDLPRRPNQKQWKAWKGAATKLLKTATAEEAGEFQKAYIETIKDMRVDQPEMALDLVDLMNDRIAMLEEEPKQGELVG